MSTSNELLDRVGSAMHYDFCPWANRYVYWLKRPIGWVVWAFAASLLLGIYVSPQAFMAAGMVAAVGIIGALWPWICMIGIRGELSWSPHRCEEQELVETTLTITNRWPWPAWGLVVQADDAISSQVDAPGQPISLSRVPGWMNSRFRWSCRPSSRGVYPRCSVRLTTAFPFGIWSSHRVLHVGESLIVWPRVVRLADVPENRGTERLGIGGLSSRVGDDGDWMGVRPYREGDSLRQVHWAQTARRDSLVVFERQSRSRQSVSLALDVSAFARCSKEERDWMLRIVASLANHFLQHAWSIRFHLGERWQSLHAGNRVPFMDQLAEWEPGAGEADELPSFGSDAGLALAITSISHGVSSWRFQERVGLLKTCVDCDDVAESVSNPGDGWLLPIDASTDEHFRAIWRSICQKGIGREVAVAP